jgi:hypothetical protein
MEGSGLAIDGLHYCWRGGLVDSAGNDMPGTIHTGGSNGQLDPIQLPRLCRIYHSVSKPIAALADTGSVCHWVFRTISDSSA